MLALTTFATQSQLVCDDVRSVYQTSKCCDLDDKALVPSECLRPRTSCTYEGPSHCDKSPMTQMTQGAVSMNSREASECAQTILKQGGNAYDAMAAAQFCMGVTEPGSSGLGGGLFAVGRHTSGEVFALDGREEAPEHFTEDAYTGGDWWQYSTEGMSVGVPGTLAAIDRLVSDHGTKTLAQTLQPAIDLLEKGAVLFPAQYARQGIVTADGTIYPSYRLAHANHQPTLTLRFCATGEFTWTTAPDLSAGASPSDDPSYVSGNFGLISSGDLDPATAAFGGDYVGRAKCMLESGHDGVPYQVNDRVFNPDLKMVYEQIAANGAQWFYDKSGPFATKLIEELGAVSNRHLNSKARNGVMKASDLEGYRAVYREPLHTKYQGSDLYFMNMPTSGGLSSVMLAKYMECAREQNGFSSQCWNDIDYLRSVNAGMRTTMQDRSKFMADVDFKDVPVDGLQDAAYIHERCKAYVLADPVPASIPPGCPPGFDCDNMTYSETVGGTDTTNMVVADTMGNSIVITSSIESTFGAGFTVWGVQMNNELSDFDWGGNTLNANNPEGGKKLRKSALGSDALTMGGKRPRSSMSPTIAVKADGTIVGVGSAGGSRIFFSNMWSLLRVLDSNDCIYDSMYPRMVSRWSSTAEVGGDGSWPSAKDTYKLDQKGVKIALKGSGLTDEGIQTGSYISKLSIVMVRPDGYGAAASDTLTMAPTDTHSTSTGWGGLVV